jgi:hypothetical protein
MTNSRLNTRFQKFAHVFPGLEGNAPAEFREVGVTERRAGRALYECPTIRPEP